MSPADMGKPRQAQLRLEDVLVVGMGRDKPPERFVLPAEKIHDHDVRRLLGRGMLLRTGVEGHDGFPIRLRIRGLQRSREERRQRDASQDQGAECRHFTLKGRLIGMMEAITGR